MTKTKKIYYLDQIIKITNFTEEELKRIEDEGLIEIRIENNVRYFLDEDLEKLRFIKMLMDEFEINLPGIDVILHMRQKMIELQNNFIEFIENLKKELYSQKQYVMNKQPDDVMVKKKGDIEPFEEN